MIKLTASKNVKEGIFLSDTLQCLLFKFKELYNLVYANLPDFCFGSVGNLTVRIFPYQEV